MYRALEKYLKVANDRSTSMKAGDSAAAARAVTITSDIYIYILISTNSGAPVVSE
jgi:hypothetical protein